MAVSDSGIQTVQSGVFFSVYFSNIKVSFGEKSQKSKYTTQMGFSPSYFPILESLLGLGFLYI